ncbi:hypothetical protein J122_171 [Marinobacter excellens LAMA 842]|uniref:Uncharacterized protein n=1 Tax=Marinobacter excellens LAMA 842 TaxID=1306954 RepID=A0A137SI80_9GAMM|nr:hypothetical protein J122_171 [Marinobacter excellens LAMA 842]
MAPHSFGKLPGTPLAELSASYQPHSQRLWASVRWAFPKRLRAGSSRKGSDDHQAALAENVERHGWRDRALQGCIHGRFSESAA